MRFGNRNEGEPDDYPENARKYVVAEYNELAKKEGRHPIELDDVYVVWFCKTLQNWKALLSTTTPDDKYYEVTYDGDKSRAYIDTYVKTTNSVFTDGLF